VFKIALMGSRYFGAQVFEALRQESGVQIVTVVAPAADDRLALAAQAAGVPLHLLANPKVVPGEAVPEGTDLIVAAHTHARVSNEALDRARLRGVGYHPSLLPRHRGIAAVEWTILEGDPIAGGSVYHLADGWDAGAIAAQDWCFVGKGETARELWERALAPMGLRLLTQVVQHARDHGEVPAMVQDPRFATRAPMLRKAAVKAEGAAPAAASLVVLVVGPDRPGIVRQIADRAARHGANWAASRMASVAGEFAGMVQFELEPAGVPALTEALRALESTGLRVVVAAGDAAAGQPAGARAYELQLVGEDRVGIVSQFTAVLAERGVSIDSLHTELLHDPAQTPPGRPRFKVAAHVHAPRSVDIEALKRELDALAQKLMVDIALDDRVAG
jgi:glycine cleavage system regulatory protein/folate-dependent phosphoribosylglycinamide formyltransferase PurN